MPAGFGKDAEEFLASLPKTSESRRPEPEEETEDQMWERRTKEDFGPFMAAAYKMNRRLAKHPWKFQYEWFSDKKERGE